ncbi:hypothetical protein AAFN75_16660 [Algibacter sp. AS12]|uniref:hypothetical protein n=1 Tax=Algibacter sp. AS12 TaxID=3135773 RepID=UPI00398B070E
MLGLLALFLGISTLIVTYLATSADNKNTEEFQTRSEGKLDNINKTNKDIDEKFNTHKIELDSSLKNLESNDKKIYDEVSNTKEISGNSSKDIKKIITNQKNTSNVMNDINFNTESARFFQEHPFEKYGSFFKYGYVVYHHNSEFEKPFKKAYGSKIFVEYIEYSDNVTFGPHKSGTENLYTLGLNIKFKKIAGESYIRNGYMEHSVLVNSFNVEKVQKLPALSGYGHPYYNFCDYFILLNHEKPFTYAIGPQDCGISKNI